MLWNCARKLVNTISPDCLVRSSLLNLVCVFPMMSTWTLLFLVQIRGLFGSKLRKIAILGILWNCARKHDKSRLPGPIKFKLGVCVPHDEYMNPIVFGADPMSFWVKTEKKWTFFDFFENFLVNMISPDCLLRSSLNLVCVFPMMRTGTGYWCVSDFNFDQKLKNKKFWYFCLWTR